MTKNKYNGQDLAHRALPGEKSKADRRVAGWHFTTDQISWANQRLVFRTEHVEFFFYIEAEQGNTNVGQN